MSFGHIFTKRGGNIAMIMNKDGRVHIVHICNIISNGFKTWSGTSYTKPLSFSALGV